jgi:hypothetical protein
MKALEKAKQVERQTEIFDFWDWLGFGGGRSGGSNG